MEDCQDTFMFIVDGERIEVNKIKLASKVHYFSVLFSGNYVDSSLNEYIVKLHWTTRNIKDLVEWVNDTEDDLCADNAYIKQSIQKFINGQLEQLVGLLDIANYFLIDDLRNDLKSIIIKYWLKPENVIKFVFAKNEPFMKDVRDVAFAMCIEQFSKLPVEQLLQLSQDNFLEIVGNCNLQCENNDYLKQVMEKWYNVNCKKYNISEKYFQHLIMIILKERRIPDKLQSFVVHQFEESNKKIIVFFWNGLKVFDIALNLPFTSNPKEPLVGAQIVARGFDIYLVGGKFGLGNGQFNMDIWRYSFLTKQWYYVTSLREPRRHMSVTFWKTRLYLIGGIGRFRIKDDTMRYYDIETGEWSEAMCVKGYFNQIPYNCIIDDKIFLVRSLFYSYDPQVKNWKLLNVSINEKSIIAGLQSIASCGHNMLCAVCRTNCAELWNFDTKQGHCVRMEFPYPIAAIVTNDREVIAFHYSDRKIIVMTGYLSESNMTYKSKFYYKQCIDYKFGDKSPLGSFNINNPQSLYQQIPALSKYLSSVSNNVNLCNCSKNE